MTSMTSYLQKALLDHFLDLTTYTAPSPLYLSLHTASPTDTGSQAAEVSGGGYARQSLDTNMTAADATSGISTLNTTLIFGPATAEWGVVSYIGMDDALTSGNMCIWAPSSAPRLVPTGQSVQFVSGQIALRFA